MIAPSLAIPQPASAISSTVAWGPAGLGWLVVLLSPTGSPAAAQAVSHVVMSFASGMTEVARGRSKSMSMLKPKSFA